MRRNRPSHHRAEPTRTCIGCRKRGPKASLSRLVVNEDHQVVWDLRQVLPGRGAYVCPREECLVAALKKGRLARALRCPFLRTSDLDGARFAGREPRADHRDGASLPV